MDVEMLRTTNVARRGEINQPQAIGGTVCMEAELSNYGAKDTLPPDTRIEIYEDDICFIGRAFILYVLVFDVEDILNHIFLFFGWGVSIN